MKSFSGQRFFCILGVLTLAAVLFSAGAAWADVSPVWTNNYQGSDGTNAVVAVQGSKTFVAYSNEAGNNGRVEMYDSKGIQLPSYDLGDLAGGRIKAITVSGSKVYVAGYYGVAGSGLEIGFLWAFKASSKGLTKLWDGASPDPLPNAGLYPMGIKAQGSKVVSFFNIDSGDESSVRGKIMAMDPKTGENKWGPNDFGNPDYANKVNAIAIKGSKVNAAGTMQDIAGFKYFAVSEYSATTGDYFGGGGTSYGGPGAENEALAIAWSGSVLGVAGYITTSPGTQKAHAVSIITKGMYPVLELPDVDLEHGENRFTNVVVRGSTIYAAGYGKNASDQNEAFVRAYNAKTGEMVGQHNETGTLAEGVTTTGLAVGKKGVYLAGYDAASDTQASWLVRAYDLNLTPTWQRDFGGPSGGTFAQALDIAMGAKAVIAVGQVKDGDSGNLYAGVEAYTP